MTMLGDTLAYLSGPITAKDGYSLEYNISVAVDAWLALIRLGIPTICPHLSGLCPSAYAIPHAQWIDFDKKIIRRSTHVLTLPRWRTSKGAVEEVEYATSLGMPIHSARDVLSGEVTL